MTKPRFPRLRWAAACWLAVWVPAYWWTYGWENFLQLTLILTGLIGVVYGITHQILLRLLPPAPTRGGGFSQQNMGV